MKKKFQVIGFSVLTSHNFPQMNPFMTIGYNNNNNNYIHNITNGT